jgi:hypothetical protein
MIESTRIYSDNRQVLIAEIPTTIVQLYDSLRPSHRCSTEQSLAALYGWKTIFRDIKTSQDMDESIRFIKAAGFLYPDDFIIYHVYQMLDTGVTRCGLCANYSPQYDGFCSVNFSNMPPMAIMPRCFDRRGVK